ncbi:TonB-dependent receptor [Nisaea acidiphila]|uniref:TonB-dependent receptor n=1 Tax=Nisaea acidiphila TaxID=1862145 RepID=A0A9J7AVD5_9PROT|nr:TonB-dependent receptor [Nisaea acidiphila]UUX51078.1 TonB-dependent receptor [Nisaea acidiphila]
MKRLFLTALTASTALTAVAAQAQDSTDPVALDQITVTSVTRTETPVEESTVSVTVVTREEIEQQSTVNTPVGEILGKTVPGFGQPTQNLTEYGQTLRGRNFLTLIDGVPQTNTLNNNYRALNSISSSAVEQIEVVRGATAAYGFGAPGGLVNIITKRPEDGEINYDASAGFRFQPEDVGDSASYNANVGASGRTGHIDYLVNGNFDRAGSSFTADGERRPPDSYGTQGGTDDVDSYNFLGKVGFEREDHRLQLSANYYDYTQDSDWAGVVGGGSIANNTSATPSRGNLNTKKPGIENLTLNATYSNIDVLGSAVSLQGYFNNNTTTFTRTEFLNFVYNQYETESEKYGTRLTIDTPLPVDALPVNLIWGMDYIHDKTVVNDIDAPSTVPDYTMNGYAPFAQLQADLTPELKVTGGVRYEFIDVDIPTHVNELGTTVNGGTVDYREPLFNISASYQLLEGLGVFGGYSEGFQLGDLGRYLYDSGFTDVSQLSSEGQKTESYELGFRIEHGGLLLEPTVFYNESNNGVTYDENLNIQLAPEKVYGVEVNAAYALHEKVDIGGTFTWLEGRYDANGDGDYDTDLGSDRIAPHKITTFIEARPWDIASFRLQSLYSGYRNPDSNQFSGLQTIEDYFIVDLLSRFQVGPGVLSFGVENLFDESYVPVLQQSYSVQSYAYDDYYYVKGPGRTVSLAYSVKF